MKSTCKIYRAAIGLFIVLCSAFKPVLASHTAGASLTYTHLAGGTYRFHLEYYRDCFGIAAPQYFIMQENSISCNISASDTLRPLAGTGTDIILKCPGTLTTCNGGAVMGMQKWEYEKDVNLSGQCADWIFSVDVCCRGSVITTLQNAPNYSIYVEARLNNLTSDNNSPQFTNDPILSACVDQDFHYNNGMFDPDGDSIAYQLICSLGGPNACISYQPGHSPMQPFISIPPVSLDSFTGDYFMHPTGIEVGTVAYLVLDYRNGELVGSVMRDVMMYTSACTNHNPEGTEMNGTTQQIAYVFPGDTICFDILSNDTDATDTLSMTWNNTIPAASFYTTGWPHPTGHFCWIPSINDVRSQPYMFTAFIRDDLCPLNNAAVYSYYIYVTLDSSLVFLSAKNPEQYHGFSLFPNPSDGIATIHSSEKFSQIKIWDAYGRCVPFKETENRIDISSQPPGIYFVEVDAAGGQVLKTTLLKE